MDLDLENVDFSDNEEEHDVEIPVSEPSGLIEFSLDTQGELLRDNVEKSKKRKSVLRAQFTQDDMRTAIGIHYSELKEAVDRTRRLANCCCDEELSGIMLSILPENLVDPPREHTTFELSALGHLRALLSWFGDSFTLVPDMDVSEEEGWDGLGHDELLHGIDSRSGSRTQLTQLFAALLQGLTATFDTAEVGVFVRLAATLDPMPCQASLIPGLKEQRLAEAAERRCVASSQSSTAHERESTHRPATDAQGEDNSRVRIGNRLHADTRRSTGLLRSSAGLLIPRDIKRIRDNYNNENYSGSSSSSSSSSDGSGSGSSSSSDLQIDSSNHSTVHLNSPVNALETVATCSSYRPTHKTCVWLEVLLSMPYSSAVQNTERRKANPRLTGPRQGGNKEATSNTAEAREEAKACAPASSAKAPLESLGSVSGPEGAPSSASLVDLTGDSDCDTGVSHDPGTRCAPPESQAQARAQGPDCLTRWVSVDVASGTVDCPEWVERERGGGSTGTVAYVCAVPLPPSTVASPLAPESLPALDVTRRYAASYRAACQQRLERALPAAARWLDSVFSRQANGPEVARSAVYHSVDSSGSSNGSGSGGRRGDGDFLAAAGMTEQEKAELEARAYNEAVPTNLAGFKNHPRYALGRLLGSTQAFDPAKKRLLHVWKGEMVYNREAVSEVLSASQWKRKGMQVPKMIFDTDDTDDTDYIEDWKWKHQEVVPRESERPAKTKAQKLRGKRGGQDEEESFSAAHGRSQLPVDADGRVHFSLYGAWQVEPYVIAPLVDGIIPMNEHGNIEIWDGNRHLLPPGTCLLEEPGAAKVAATLGIQFRKAVYGFESKGGCSFPKYGGIVVLTEHAAVVREGSFCVEQGRTEKSVRRQHQAVLQRWRKLVRAALNRARLREEWGH